MKDNHFFDDKETKTYTIDLVVNTSYTADFDARMDEDEVRDHLRNEAETHLKNKDVFYFDAFELQDHINFREGD